ncbi:MAG: hypothetical protein UT82_C0028G0005 [Parcubacteria group bacterium GW2011_GWB1_40_14]|nr:MAG: hypothetical protein UT82_C0028G0005 [Parcubacteria group bacterium GW2011_GWB1_40_14]
MPNILKKILAVIGALAVFSIAVFVVSQQPQGASGFSVVKRVDILGTGTSTAGTYNFGAAATTSVLFTPTESTDTLDFDIYSESASSSAHLGIQILQSSLAKCNATGGNNQNWVDSKQIITATAHINTLTQATTTYQWIPSTRLTGGHIQLTNVNAQCMKIYVGGASVNVYIQAVLKSQI